MKKLYMLLLTAAEAKQLWSLCQQANGDGDHREWMKNAGAKPSELKALDSVMLQVEAKGLQVMEDGCECKVVHDFARLLGD